MESKVEEAAVELQSTCSFFLAFLGHRKISRASSIFSVVPDFLIERLYSLVNLFWDIGKYYWKLIMRRGLNFFSGLAPIGMSPGI